MPHVELTFAGDTILHSRLRRSQASRLGKRRTSSSVGRLHSCEKKRPQLRDRDRVFWMALKKIWKDWKTALVIVQPETVISWQRKRYWWRLSRPKGPGRPRVLSEIRSLVRTMAAANPIWGAPRIYGELLKLGFEISERTVSRLMPRDRNPTQTWLTFLRNHVGQLVSIDFFTVATIRLRVLYVFSVLAHDRRRVIHFNVTGRPTAVWAAQQIVEAFPEDRAPRFMVRDRDESMANSSGRGLKE